MDNNGKVSYVKNVEGKLRGDAKRMVEIIDDNSIKVNIVTRDSDKTSAGNLLVGGAFMGNIVSVDSSGDTKVEAFQEVNPKVFAIADEHTKKTGKLMMHEVTEAYEGAKISKVAGVGVGPATQTDVDNPKSVYSRAHEKATKQTTISERYFDASNKEITDISKSYRIKKVEWSVTRGNKRKVIQSKRVL